MDDNFERGMETKKTIEKIFTGAQIVMYVLLLIMLYVLFNTTSGYKTAITVTILLLWLTRFLNPITANYNLYKGQKQLLFSDGPSKNTEDDIEAFDGTL
jgi:NhaP-type Na+/H+ and K+/H+ antiporter